MVVSDLDNLRTVIKKALPEEIVQWFHTALDDIKSKGCCFIMFGFTFSWQVMSCQTSCCAHTNLMTVVSCSNDNSWNRTRATP